jgi:hypothetical protein
MIHGLYPCGGMPGEVQLIYKYALDKKDEITAAKKMGEVNNVPSSDESGQ